MQLRKHINIVNRQYDDFIFSISKKETTTLIFYTVTIDLIITILFSKVFFSTHSSGPTFDSKIEAFILAVLVSPLFETLIFQHWVIKLILKKCDGAKLLSCLVSAVLFAASHYYSWAYVLKTFISGLLFGSLYLVSIRMNKNPIFMVFLSHAIYNSIGFVIDILTGSF